MSGMKAIAADVVFNGEGTHRKMTVLFQDGRIESVMHTSQVRKGIPTYTLPRGAWLAPGFIDVQVNGGGDVLFNDTPTADAIDTITAAHRRFGTTSLLPTLITDTPEAMRAAATAVQAAMKRNSSVIGVHFEGPFLSPGKPGIHDPAKIRRPQPDDLEFLTRKRRGATLVTLAPEEVPEGFIRTLVDAGVVVSLGHSMATYAQTWAAFDEGLTGFTHLFNAMRPLESREAGPIGAALENPSAFFGVIVDGIHVAPATLRVAMCRGPKLRMAMWQSATPILVTDAMPPVGGSRPGFTLNGRAITVQDGRCAAADGTLAGAALDMASAVRNAVALLHLPLIDALKMASNYPAAFLGFSDEIGHIAEGFRADFVAFMPDNVEVVATWVAGEMQVHGLREAPQSA